MRAAAASLFIAVLVAPVATRSAEGQSYHLDWLAAAGGAGSSAGGAYWMPLTIGQPSVTSSSGGGYLLSAGVWGGGARVDAVIRLRTFRSQPDGIIVAWPANALGWQLQSAPALPAGADSWTTLAVTPSMVGSEQQIRLPLVSDARFFRLQRAGP